MDLLKLKNLETQYKSNDLPIDTSEFNLSDHIYADRLSNYQYQNAIEKQLSEALDDHNGFGYPRFSNVDQYGQYDGDLVGDESKISILREQQCSINEKACNENESCIQLDPKSPIGICRCNIGFSRNTFQKCVPDNFNPDNLNDKLMMIKQMSSNREDPVVDGKSDSSEVDDSKIGRLSVSVVSKTVQLPDKKATLSAFPVPDETTSGSAYNYSWSLIAQPNNDLNGTMSDKAKSEILLSNLSEGLYKFKVVVSGKGLRGEAFANVTVLPEKRFNKAPIVVITPAQQIIKAPSSTGNIFRKVTENLKLMRKFVFSHS